MNQDLAQESLCAIVLRVVEQIVRGRYLNHAPFNYLDGFLFPCAARPKWKAKIKVKARICQPW